MEILLNSGETTVYVQGIDLEFKASTAGVVVGACDELIVESRYVDAGMVSLKVFPRSGKPFKITNGAKVAVVVPTECFLPAAEDEEAYLPEDCSFPGDDSDVDASAPAAGKKITRSTKKVGRPKGTRK